MQRLSDHADVSSQGWTGSICGIPACITRPLSHCRKLNSCQLAIFLALKSLGYGVGLHNIELNIEIYHQQSSKYNYLLAFADLDAALLLNDVIV